MSETQLLTVALATVPTMLAVLVGILINNSRFNDLNARFNDMNAWFGELRSHVDARFDDMKETWRSELHRVEEVLDARLKHIEER